MRPTVLTSLNESIEVSACFKRECLGLVGDSSQDTGRLEARKKALVVEKHFDSPSKTKKMDSHSFKNRKVQGKDSLCEIKDMIFQLTAIENVLQDITKARNSLEPSFEPEEIPSTIFTVNKVESLSKESFGQRLHRKAIERQKRLAARRLEAQQHDFPRLHLVATEARKKKSKKPFKNCGTSLASVQTYSTGTSRSSSLSDFTGKSTYDVHRLLRKQERRLPHSSVDKTVSSKLWKTENRCAAQRKTNIRSKEMTSPYSNKGLIERKKSHRKKNPTFTHPNLKGTTDELVLQVLKQLELNFRDSKGSGKNGFQLYNEPFESPQKLKYYKQRMKKYVH